MKPKITYRYNDKNGRFRGILRGDIISVIDKDRFAKKEDRISFDVPIQEIKDASKWMRNLNTVVHNINITKYDKAVEKWIESSPTEELRNTRRKFWETDEEYSKYSASTTFVRESADRVVKHIYQEYLKNYEPKDER